MKIPIYLTGPVRNFSVHQREEFEKAKAALVENHKTTVVTVLDLYEEFDPNADECPHDEIMKQRINMVCMAGMVVFLNDYEQDARSTFEVKTAKFLNITTIGINFAIKPESIHENRNDSTKEPESANASDSQR